MKKILKILFSRLFFIILAVLTQLTWIVILVWKLNEISTYVSFVMSVISFIAVLILVNRRINPAYKLAWTILILSFPILGAVIYFLFGKSRVAKKLLREFETLEQDEYMKFIKDITVMKELRAMDKHIANQSYYIEDSANWPVYKGTTTTYFSVGEDMYKEMMLKLENAEKFIFMEYFIMKPGKMWDSILAVLEKKVKAGVDVRIIYDDMGCVTTLPAKYYKKLQSKGIKCAAFNPFRPILSIILNNRDHRKILVVDGDTSFTGGMNLSDEYINEVIRFGHWKDTGVMLKGDAVWSFTLMFLQMWKVITGMQDDFKAYAPHMNCKEKSQEDGFVQPYCDSPLDSETVGENVYMNLITKAKDYVYIFTPYLIIDNEMMSALCLASRSGVDVRIVTPHIPDKKTAFLLTRSYYSQLIDAGVRIYEYLPGFLHAKSFVCDDEAAIVGTINLDYRSLYLHFECGVFIYKSNAVMDVKHDSFKTIQNSQEISREFCANQNIVIRIIQNILRLLAPLF